MDIKVVAVAATILVTIARLCWAWKRKDPLGETFALALLAGLGAASLTVGVCMAPYYLVKRLWPDQVSFYSDWPSEPLFVTFAGLAYGLLGLVATIRVFQQKRV